MVLFEASEVMASVRVTRDVLVLLTEAIVAGGCCFDGSGICRLRFICDYTAL